MCEYIKKQLYQRLFLDEACGHLVTKPTMYRKVQKAMNAALAVGPFCSVDVIRCIRVSDSIILPFQTFPHISLIGGIMFCFIATS